LKKNGKKEKKKVEKETRATFHFLNSPTKSVPTKIKILAKSIGE
jgi:hypothetical protein